MPRLLSLNNYHYRRGGADAIFLAHDALFADRGWDTATFCMKHPNNSASPWSDFFVDELQFGESYNAAQKVGMASKVIYSFEAKRKLRSLLEKFSPDIAHVHCIYHHISPAVLGVLKQRGVPVVLTAHDLKLACPAYKMMNSTGLCERCRSGNYLNVIRHRCIHDSVAASAIVAAESILHAFLNTYQSCLDRIVVPSQFYLRKLVEWGWSEARLVHLPYFIDSRGIDTGHVGTYLIYFGRLSSEKGLATLVRAVARSGRALKIVGTGPEETSLRRLVDRLRAPVEFLGYQSGTRLQTLIAESRAVVLPSEWYENQPMAVLEAFGAAKVVIGANIGGIPELLAQQPNVFLFESRNIAELEAAIEATYAMPESDLTEIGRNNLSMLSTYSPNQYFQKMTELYRSLA